MTHCKCGFNVGDHVITVGWDGKSPEGCWVDGMRHHVGKDGIITIINHDYYDGQCVVELDGVEYLWETGWLEHVSPYSLF